MIESLNEPVGDEAIVSAGRWIESTLLGTVATSIAIVAVAYIGLLMLTGRLPIRRGLTVVMGCFLIFGASSIVAALAQIPTDEAGSRGFAQERVAPKPAGSTTQRLPPSSIYDPYAGASVPNR